MLSIGEKKYSAVAIVIAIALIIFITLKGGKAIKKFLDKRAANKKLDKTKVEVDKDLILKSDERIREIAYGIYEALKGPGTDDDRLEALILSLSKEERKAVANEFVEILKQKGETASGNIVNWLEDDGRHDLARKFIAVGIKPMETGWTAFFNFLF